MARNSVTQCRAVVSNHIVAAPTCRNPSAISRLTGLNPGVNLVQLDTLSGVTPHSLFLVSICVGVGVGVNLAITVPLQCQGWPACIGVIIHVVGDSMSWAKVLG